MQLQIPGLEEPLDIPDEDFARTPPSVLKAFMDALTKLAARVADLEEKLNANSRNSSLPPSKDPPGTLRAPKRSSGKSRGGQPGRKGVNRSLVDQAQVTDTKTFKLAGSCPDCNAQIPEDVRSVDIRQIWEIPKIEPTVLEVREERAICHAAAKCLRPVSLRPRTFPAETLARIWLPWLASCRVASRSATEIAKNYSPSSPGFE